MAVLSKALRPRVIEADDVEMKPALHDAFGDSEIRQALRSWLRAIYADDADSVVIEELGICRGQARIDLAVINGVIHGYEIKSDRDSLRRLGNQMDFYSKVLDKATLVVGDRYLTDVLSIVPGWWGILNVKSGRNGPRFESVRCSRDNPRQDPRSLVELLWLDDAVALLAEREAARGVRGKSRRVVWDRVCEQFALHEIAASVRGHLKARATQQAASRPS